MKRTDLSTIQLEEPVPTILEKMSKDFANIFEQSNAENRPTAMYSAMLTAASVQKKISEDKRESGD